MKHAAACQGPCGAKEARSIPTAEPDRVNGAQRFKATHAQGRMSYRLLVDVIAEAFADRSTHFANKGIVQGDEAVGPVIRSW